MSIKESAYILRLPFIRNNYEECARKERLKDMSFEDFLAELLKNEVELRTRNSIKTRIRRAEFRYPMILQDYKREHLSIEIRKKLTNWGRLKTSTVSRISY